MKILHVTLGNPDTRQGGLNRYCGELSRFQRMSNERVDIIYPGTFINSNNPRIKKRKEHKYEIFDALPVAITYGIDNPDRYMVSTKNDVFQQWLLKQNYDVIHVHSIQGIHLEFFEAAEKLGIPMIFTTHDYYPICFRCVLFDKEHKLCDEFNDLKCTECVSGSGLSKNKQRIIQSNSYQLIKSMKIANLIKKKSTNNEITIIKDSVTKDNIKNVKELRNYYYSIMSKMSIIHCNSNLTFNEYDRYFPNLKKIVTPITHNGLNRSLHRKLQTNHLNISYMGGAFTHKGYKMMENLINELAIKYPTKFDFWLYGGIYSPSNDYENCHYKGYFDASEAKFVWEHTDLLIVPSQWKETFGFIVLEALCRGIPVVCSSLVGSKDLLEGISTDLIFKYDDYDSLKKIIMNLLNEDIYNHLLEKINKMSLEYDMEQHVCSISSLYSLAISGEKND